MIQLKLSGIAASGHVGNALRRALILSGAPFPAAGEPSAGILILNADDTVQSQTPEAARLLREAQQSDGELLPLPVAVYSVAHQARAVAARQAPASRATARMWLRHGRWLAIEAAPLDDADGEAGRVAILLQNARAAQLVSLVLASGGLTAREQQIALMLLRGNATEQIARRLVISPAHPPRPHEDRLLQAERDQPSGAHRPAAARRRNSGMAFAYLPAQLLDASPDPREVTLTRAVLAAARATARR